MKDELIYYWISEVSGWSWKRHEKLLSHYGNIRNIFLGFVRDREFVASVLTQKVYDRAAALLDEKSLQKQVDAIRKAKIDLICPSDEDFPFGVLQMNYDRPFILYYCGDRALFRSKGIAVVGTRRTTFYGEKQTQRFVRAFTEQGLTIVSGLADGIDSIAHKACLELGGNTIAVLGSGLKHITPVGNVALARDIVRNGGLIVSEFAPDFVGSKYSFPHRNRLIAALSEGVMFSEGGERSGAIYTANHAVEQGKSVYLLPCNVDTVNAGGWLKLYRNGVGTIVSDPKEVLDDLGISAEWKEEVQSGLQLDVNCQKILDSLAQGALNYDSLFELVDLDHADMSMLLIELEMSGLIENRGSLYYKV